MCGIAVIYNYRTGEAANEALLQAMVAAQAHRGPDARGFFADGAIGLGHCRLSIIDPDGGQQPMANAAGSLHVVFNGEIYNHRHLRSELEGCGHRFASACDTEVLLHGYEHWGSALVDHLHGAFAFVLWDAERRRVVAGRDRLGEKPLFFANTPGGVAFASEEKALLIHPEVAADIDEQAVQQYLFVGYVLTDRSMFAAVHSLPPGHLLLCEDGQVQQRRYWQLPADTSEPVATADVAEQVTAAVDTAVTSLLEADVPLGAALSGGLDSSTVVAYAARRLPELPTFTVSYSHNRQHFLQHPSAAREGQTSDDTEAAVAAATAFGTEHSVVSLAADDLAESVEALVRLRDRPLLALVEHGHFELYRHARQRVTVLLSGGGGDEVFGGYYYWLARRNENNTDYFPWIWRSPTPLPLARASTTHDLIEAMLCPDFADAAETRAYTGDLFRQRLAQAPSGDFGNRLSQLLLTIHLPELMAIDDRLGFANGVEVRAPLVDTDLVELVAALPSSLKVTGRGDKPLLRAAAARLVPDAVLGRTKNPFPVPFATEEFFRHICAVLGRERLAVHRFLSPAALAEFVAGFAAPGTGAKRYAAFRLYTLELFLRQHGG